MYGTSVQSFTYTGSENIDITYNRVSLNSIIKANGEIVLNPRAYDGAVFDMLSDTDSFAFRQNTIHGGQPITIFDSSTKACTFNGGSSIPDSSNKSSIDNLISNIYIDVDSKTEIDSLIASINLINFYTKTEADDIDNGLANLNSEHLEEK